MTTDPSSPILIESLIDDPQQVAEIYERAAPYHPLGGWFRPDQEGGEATSPMWFQGDWVHADLRVPGSELFLDNARLAEVARRFSGCDVIEPHTVYVNLMAAIAECGPAHTDNPVFRGRDRTNTPMLLLRKMLWSGLFTRWEIPQVTSIWWMNDVDGGAFSYWSDGASKQPREHVGAMANSALVGDNHHMFHQVGPVGPFDAGTRRVAASSALGPVADGSGDWIVTEQGREVYRAPFNTYRASVLWKANVYASEAERREVADDLLSMDEVAQRFDADLTRREEPIRFDREHPANPGFLAELGRVYPEAVPFSAGRSMFDAA